MKKIWNKGQFTVTRLKLKTETDLRFQIKCSKNGLNKQQVLSSLVEAYLIK